MSDAQRVNMEKHQHHHNSPTVVPSQFFLANEDAATLHKAMKGMGTDEKAIINILAKRSLAQRLQIITQFQQEYGKDLIKELKSELSGDFKKLIVALMTPLPQLYAEELHHAIKGLGTNEDVLIEVLCTLNNADIAAIRHAYHQKFKKSLENDIQSDTSGYFKNLLVNLCQGQRDESSVTDSQTATSDAKKLYDSGENCWGTDESTFNEIFSRRSYLQLRLVFKEYEVLTLHSIKKAIKNEFSGDIKEGLLAIVESVQNRPRFFAKKLHQCMKGIGTKDRDLIRIVVTRSEIDMGCIKREYEAKFSKTLADDIKGDCSGDYKKCLLALIGES